MFLICSIKKNINFASSPRRRRIKCRERHRYSVSYVMWRYHIWKRRLSRALFTDSLKAQETLKLQSRNMATIDATGYDTIVSPHCILMCVYVNIHLFLYTYTMGQIRSYRRGVLGCSFRLQWAIPRASSCGTSNWQSLHA